TLSLNPGDRPALAAKGQILLDLGKVPEAQRVFEDGLILDPNNLEFLGGKAACMAHQGHYDDALSLLTVVLQKVPNHYAAHRTTKGCGTSGQPRRTARDFSTSRSRPTTAHCGSTPATRPRGPARPSP